MQSEEPEIIRVHPGPTEDEEGLINRAESLHISDTRIAATRTEQTTDHVNIIDPTTRHIIADPDTAAAYRTAGPDRDDLPSERVRSGGGGGGGRGGGSRGDGGGPPLGGPGWGEPPPGGPGWAPPAAGAVLPPAGDNSCLETHQGSSTETKPKHANL